MKTLILSIILILSSTTANAKDFNKKYASIIKDIIWAADKAEVPRELVLAVCWGESNFRTKGVTHLDGETLSHSICQMKLATAQHMDAVYRHRIKATSERLESTRINAFYAAKLIKYQLDRYDDNWKLAIDAYNKGTAVSERSEYVRRFIKSLDFIKTHVKSIVYSTKHE